MYKQDLDLGMKKYKISVLKEPLLEQHTLKLKQEQISNSWWILWVEECGEITDSFQKSYGGQCPKDISSLQMDNSVQEGMGWCWR